MNGVARPVIVRVLVEWTVKDVYRTIVLGHEHSRNIVEISVANGDKWQFVVRGLTECA